MPGFDGTGPLGQGPLTGRGRGYCIEPVKSENSIPIGYSGAQGYPGSTYNPYGSDYIRYGFSSYNYPWYAGNRAPIFQLISPIGIRCYGRFSRFGRGIGRRWIRF